MKSNHYLAALLLLFTAPSHALLNSDAKPGSAEFLISACQEYTELYEKKDQARFGAFLTTSKEELSCWLLPWCDYAYQHHMLFL